MKFLVQALLFVATRAAITLPTEVPSKNINSRGADPQFDYDPSTTPWCTWWYDNEDGSVKCEDVPSFWGITMKQFQEWNPTIKESCSNYIVEKSYCVEGPSDDPEPTTTKGTTTTSPTPTTTKPDNGITTPEPTQPGMVDNCNKFFKVQKGDTCQTIADKSNISIKEFVQWNKKVGGADCTGLWLDTYVCVSVIGHKPTPTKPGNGITTPTPIQPGMVSNCDKFFKVKKGDSCQSIADKSAISLAQFTKWNPKVGGSECSGLWLDVYVCVSIVGHEPTPTKPGNGISTPTPTQPGMVGNCNKFYKVKKGDNCESISKKSGISVKEFTKWNPKVGGTACTGLWLDNYVCVNIVGHKPTPTKPGNGVSTPTPIQTGMTKKCKKFHYIKKGENCDTITKKYKITKKNFLAWNPAAGKDCKGLWAKTYCCVAIL